jgi:hypothetical protein
MIRVGITPFISDNSLDTPGISKIKGARGDALVQAYKKAHGDCTILAFSRGKDSIATALALCGRIDVVPFTYIHVDGLSFVEESLAYYEKHLFGRRIARFPHGLVYHLFDIGAYQPIKNWQIYFASKLGDPIEGMMGMSYYGNIVRKELIADEGIKTNALIALGVQASDSPQRWLSFQRHGAIRAKQGAWYPIWNYARDRLLGEIQCSGLKLPVDYHLFGKSFDGIKYEYLVPLKRERPDDYRKIIERFPYAEAEVWKYERWCK